MIALITPTGAREYQLKLCAHYMAKQTYSGDVVWVIIDDALPRTSDFIKDDFRAGWHVLKGYPAPPWQIGQNTQGRNLKAGVDLLLQNYSKNKIEAIFIIEDDDFYRPQYLASMVALLDGCLVLGESQTIYYNVRLNRWIENGNDVWSSLFQTAFKPAALRWFELLYGEKFIDYAFFRLAEKPKLFRTPDKLSIGIKGIAGRAGIGAGNGFIPHMIPDESGAKLYELLKEDAHFYLD